MDYEFELMEILNKMTISGINVKTGLHEFKYYAGISPEELKKSKLIDENTSLYQFNYEISAFEEYFGYEGYRVTVHARGKDLKNDNNCLLDEVYLPEEFNLHKIIIDLKEQELPELSEALYKKMEDTPFLNRPQPRIIIIPERDWQKIDKLAADNNLSLAEYLRKKALE